MSAGNELLFCPYCRAVYRSAVSWCPADGSQLEEGPDPLLGTVIADRYRLVELVGEGAMGRVYRAEHVHLARSFAVKVLYGELASDRVMRLRFAREARAASLLSHPNLVTVTDFGATATGLLYLVMDYVAGEPLSEYSRSRFPLSHERVIGLTRQLCEGLAYVHSRGLVHRDLKPDNIIIVSDEGVPMPRILDFGLAISHIDPGDARCTEKGMVCGTPCYMAPEHALDHDVDQRADLFSLGVIFYELLAGRTPFDGGSYDVAMLNATATPPAIGERSPDVEVGPELEGLVFRLLEKDPARRFQSAAEVILALERCAFARECDARDTSEIPALPEPREDVAAAGTGSQPVLLTKDDERRRPSPAAAAPPRRAPIAPAPGRLDTEDLVRSLRSPLRRSAPVLATVAAAGLAWFYSGELLSLWPAEGDRVTRSASAGEWEEGAWGGTEASAGTLVGAASLGTFPELSSARLGHSRQPLRVATLAPRPTDASAAEAEAVAETETDDDLEAVAGEEPEEAEEERDDAAQADEPSADVRSERRARARERRAERRSRRAKAERRAERTGDDSESLNQITGLYTKASAELARLERRDEDAAGVLRERLFAIPYSDALRIPSLRVESIAALRRLRGDIHRALQASERTNPPRTAKLP